MPPNNGGGGRVAGNGEFTFVTAFKLDDFHNPDTKKLIKQKVMDDYFRKQEGHCPPTNPGVGGQMNVIKPPKKPRGTRSTRKGANKVVDKSRQWTVETKEGSNHVKVRKLQNGVGQPPKEEEKNKMLDLAVDGDGALIPTDALLRYLMQNYQPEGRWKSALRAVQPFRESSTTTPLVYPPREERGAFPFDLAYLGIELLDIDFSDVDVSECLLLRMNHPVGGVLDPYNVLPKSDFIKHVDIEYLKMHCSLAFGTRAMGINWVPAMLQSRPAFLSTLAIAATHRDTMTTIYPAESLATTLLNREVVYIVNNLIGSVDPRSAEADPIIMSVVHLLAASMPRGTRNEMALHETGLTLMVKNRGGLGALGIRGELANVGAAIVLQSAVLRNARPADPYRHWAADKASGYFPPAPDTPIPENPLWCPRGGFYTITLSRLCIEVTYELLSECRDLVDAVFGSPAAGSAPRTLFEAVIPPPNVVNPPLDGEKATPFGHSTRARAIAARIDKFAPWTTPGTPGYNNAVYESCRLAARLFAASLSRGLPLPLALEALEREDAADRNTNGHLNGHHNGGHPSVQHDSHQLHDTAAGASPITGENSPPAQSPLLTSLRSAIQSSSLSDCWADKMTGVLYWVSLVGAAAGASTLSSPPSPTSPPHHLPHPSPAPTDAVPPPPPSGVDVTWGGVASNAANADGAGRQLAVRRVETPADGSGGGRAERRERKWLSALALRCVIVLVFQHPDAVLGTLGRMGGVMQRVGALEA